MTKIVFKLDGYDGTTEVHMQLTAVSKIRIHPVIFNFDAVAYYCQYEKCKATGELCVEDEKQELLFKKGFNYGGIGCVIAIETKKGQLFVAASLESASITKEKIKGMAKGFTNLDFTSSDVLFQEFNKKGLIVSSYLGIKKALSSKPLPGMPYEENWENTLFCFD
jgi:hypothetical protein